MRGSSAGGPGRVGSYRQSRSMVASTSFVSIQAKPSPMRLRTPPPNGSRGCADVGGQEQRTSHVRYERDSHRRTRTALAPPPTRSDDARRDHPMSLLVALVVGLTLGIGGIVGGIWKIAGAVSRQADRVGVGRLRGGLLIDRFRIPLLLWSAALIVTGAILAFAWRDRVPVIVAFIGGAAVAAIALFVLPKRAPGLLMRGLRGLRRRADRRLHRR